MGLFGHHKSSRERTPDAHTPKASATPPHRLPIEYDGGVSLASYGHGHDHTLAAAVSAALTAPKVGTRTPPKYQYPIVTPPSEAEKVVEHYRATHQDIKHSIMVQEVQARVEARDDPEHPHPHVKFASKEPITDAREQMFMERFGGDAADTYSDTDGASYLSQTETVTDSGESREIEDDESVPLPKLRPRVRLTKNGVAIGAGMH